MINYQNYPEIASICNVRVINFNDEHEGLGISLRDVAYKGYNRFYLIRFAENYLDDQCIEAVDNYIMSTNNERVNNGINEILNSDQILILYRKKNHMYAVPFDYYKNHKHSMFSGIYIAGDSSMSDMLGHHYPIGVYNRVEE